MDINIRPEEVHDHAAIHDLTKRAFAPMPFADGNDQYIVDRLRLAGELKLSLVALREGQVIGHVALSQATHDGGQSGWYGLGTIAVAPLWQRQGIGTALIARAKTWLVEHNAAGCILVGDTNYYPRHGFLPSPSHAPTREPPEYFMVLLLKGGIPEGRFSFHPLFYG